MPKCRKHEWEPLCPDPMKIEGLTSEQRTALWFDWHFGRLSDYDGCAHCGAVALTSRHALHRRRVIWEERWERVRQEAEAFNRRVEDARREAGSEAQPSL